MMMIYCYCRHLSSNNFTGQLPANLSSLTAMKQLYGSYLNFCGYFELYYKFWFGTDSNFAWLFSHEAAELVTTSYLATYLIGFRIWQVLVNCTNHFLFFSFVFVIEVWFYFKFWSLTTIKTCSYFEDICKGVVWVDQFHLEFQI